MRFVEEEFIKRWIGEGLWDVSDGRVILTQELEDGVIKTRREILEVTVDAVKEDFPIFKVEEISLTMWIKSKTVGPLPKEGSITGPHNGVFEWEGR